MNTKITTWEIDGLVDKVEVKVAKPRDETSPNYKAFAATDGRGLVITDESQQFKANHENKKILKKASLEDQNLKHPEKPSLNKQHLSYFTLSHNLSKEETKTSLDKPVSRNLVRSPYDGDFLNEYKKQFFDRGNGVSLGEKLIDSSEHFQTNIKDRRSYVHHEESDGKRLKCNLLMPGPHLYKF